MTQATRPSKVELTSEKCYDLVSSYYGRQVDQATAEYNPLGGTDTQACANCVFFMSPNGCTVVESWPVAISPTGKSKYWTAIPTYQPEPIEVIIVDRVDVEKAAQLARDIKTYESEKVQPRGMLTMLAAGFKALFDHEYGRLAADADAALKNTINTPSGFKLFKDTEGAWRWFAWVSNKWRDRDGEIIEDAAHKDFVAHLDAGGEMPEAWLWHTPGTKWGKADWADYADGFLMMSGTVDAGSEAVAEALSKEEVGVSHGFQVRYSAKDTIGWYRSFEISALPPSVAANVWTSLELVQKEAATMAMSGPKRAYLEGKLGKDKVDELERGTGDLSKSLEALGIDYKSLPDDDAPPAAAAEKAAVVNVASAMTKEQMGELADAVAKAFGESPAVKAIADNVSALGSKVEGVETTVKSLDERLKAVEATDAEKTARFFQSRITSGGGAPERPSESAKTVLNEDEAKKAAALSPSFEWLEKAL